MAIKLLLGFLRCLGADRLWLAPAFSLEVGFPFDHAAAAFFRVAAANLTSLLTLRGRGFLCKSAWNAKLEFFALRRGFLLLA